MTGIFNFSNLSLQRKLINLAVLVSSMVLLIPSSAYFIIQYQTLKNHTRAEFQNIAKLVAQNSSAAIVFKDKTESDKIISTLRSDLCIEQAVILDNNKNVVSKLYPDLNHINTTSATDWNKASSYYED